MTSKVKQKHGIVAPLRGLAVPLSRIRSDPANVRTHDARNLDAVAASLARFGQQKPIVIDSSGVIVAGNATAEAARRLGWTHVAAVRTCLKGSERTAYSLADNRTAELAGWDDMALHTLLRDLLAEDAALFEATGFREDDLADLLHDYIAQGLTDPDAVPEPPARATTKRGDLWEMGEHRLFCGDSGAAADVDRLLDAGPVAMIHTDPPYNVGVEPRSNNAIAAGAASIYPLKTHQVMDVAKGGPRRKTTARMRAKDRPLVGDNASDEEFRRTLAAWFGQMGRVLRPGGSFYVWGGYANFVNYAPALANAGLYLSQAIVWVKEHPVLTRKDFLGNHEWCFYGWREGAGHVFHGPTNVPDVWELARSGDDHSDCQGLGAGLLVAENAGDAFVILPKPPGHKLRRIVLGKDGAARFHLDGATDVWRVRKVPGQEMVHLTEKPVELAVRAIQYSSRRGETVLDLFGGSGSTLIACEQTGRKGRLMELDPLYCDVIVERYAEFTGKKATRRPRKS